MREIKYQGNEKVGEALSRTLRELGLPESPENLIITGKAGGQDEVVLSPGNLMGQRPMRWKVIQRGHWDYLGVHAEDCDGFGQDYAVQGWSPYVVQKETETPHWARGKSREEIDEILSADEADE
jgi:hypothetical protein